MFIVKRLANRYFSCPQLKKCKKMLSAREHAHVSACLTVTTRQLKKQRKGRVIVCACLVATGHRPHRSFVKPSIPV